jgi:hypothetical protein
MTLRCWKWTHTSQNHYKKKERKKYGLKKGKINKEISRRKNNLDIWEICCFSRRWRFGLWRRVVLCVHNMYNTFVYMRAVCRVRRLTLLLRAENFWRCCDGLLKTCCRPLITSKFLASDRPFHGWKSPEIAWGKTWIKFCVRLGKSRSVEPH